MYLANALVDLRQNTSMPADELARGLKESGLHVNATGADTIRAVTHLDVSRDDIEEAVKIVGAVMQ